MKRFFILLCLSAKLAAFQVAPWFGDVWEFYLNAEYILSTYSHVNHGVPDSHYRSWDQIASIDLSLSPAETWLFDVEIQAAQTRAFSYSLRSIALQSSYLCLNDLAYDPVSLALGGSLRYVTHRGWHDVSLPYHAPIQLEGFCSVGKEWTSGPDWLHHLFFWGALGCGNIGMPWLHGILTYEQQRPGLYICGLALDALMGLGANQGVPLHHFPGYGKIYHRSIDIKAHYSIDCGLWGFFDMAYMYRLYAKSFPERVQSIIFSYNLPFSLF